MKILIVKPHSLGDIINGLMAAQSLHDQLPGAQISWIAQDRFAPVVQGCPIIHQTFIFKRGDRLRGVRDVMAQVRREQFDVALDFHGATRAITMLLSSRSRRKIGLSVSSSFLAPLYPERCPLPPSGRHAHAVEILLQFLPMLGLKAEPGTPLTLKISDLESFAPQLVGRDYVLITPNARGGPDVEWPGFLELAEQLLAAHPSFFVVWDTPIVWDIPPSMQENERFVNLTGKTNLEQLLGLIQHTRLVISNDSGPMHLASALGSPTLAAFGPTFPERTGPFPLSRPTHHVVRAPNHDLKLLPCSTMFRAVEDVLSAR